MFNSFQVSHSTLHLVAYSLNFNYFIYLYHRCTDCISVEHKGHKRAFIKSKEEDSRRDLQEQE